MAFLQPHSDIRTVLFDLDDTLFDHLYSSRCGLAALAENHQCLQQVSLDELELAHIRLIDEIHPHVLRGLLTIDQARLERMSRLFRLYGDELTHTIAEQVVIRYRDAYINTFQAVPGALPLLQALHPHVRIVIITNNVLAEQQNKLQQCGLAPYIDFVVASSDVGLIKPDPAIFDIALKRVECQADETVMLGDSWLADVIGAHRAGIRAIWLNRMGIPCPDPALASEIRALEPLDQVLETIFSASR